MSSRLTSSLARFYFNIHALGRLLFSCGLFAATLIVPSYELLLGALVLAACLVRLHADSWVPLRRALVLLLWLVIPIVLLHLFFTPGRLIWPNSMIPFSSEGLTQGAWLALRLCALFFSAMAISRSLRLREWVQYISRLPRVGERLMPYVQLAAPLRRLVGDSMRRQTLRPIRQLPASLSCVFADVWQGAEAQAEGVWDSWEGKPESCINSGDVFSGMLLGLSGFGLILISVMA